MGEGGAGWAWGGVGGIELLIFFQRIQILKKIILFVFFFFGGGEGRLARGSEFLFNKESKSNFCFGVGGGRWGEWEGRLE